MAPLFPAGIIEPDDIDNYKWLEYHGIRFDKILLAMVDEVAQKYHLDARRFLLHGFSGGGHFAHRFFYLHATRLQGFRSALRDSSRSSTPTNPGTWERKVSKNDSGRHRPLGSCKTCPSTWWSGPTTQTPGRSTTTRARTGWREPTPPG
ncbi:MAG: hypothetical protein WKF83_14410 [Nocardioidaceae bacterium]